MLLKQIQNEAAIASNFFYKESNLLAQVDEVFHSMQPTCQSIYYVTTWEGKNRRCVCEGSIQKGIAIKFVQGQYVTSKKDGQIYKIQGFQYRLATLVYELGLGESTVIRNVAEEDHLEAIDLGLAVKAHFGYKAGDWVEAFWTIHRNHSYPALINAVLPDNVFDVKYWDGEKGRISRNDIVAHLSVIPRIPQKRGWCIFRRGVDNLIVAQAILYVYGDMTLCSLSTGHSSVLDADAQQSCLFPVPESDVSRELFDAASRFFAGPATGPATGSATSSTSDDSIFNVKDLVLLKLVNNQYLRQCWPFYRPENMLAEVTRVFRPANGKVIYYVTTCHAGSQRCVSSDSILKRVIPKFVKGQHVAAKENGQIYKVQNIGCHSKEHLSYVVVQGDTYHHTRRRSIGSC